MKYLFIIVAFAYSYLLVGQNLSEVFFTFDNCDVGSNVDTLSGTLMGNPSCECGLIGESYYLDGIDDGIQLDSQLTEYFLSDFTLDFYFSLDEDRTGFVDIFSYLPNCSADSALTVKYITASGDLIVEMSKNIAGFRSVVTPLPDNCWNRFTLTRSALVYTVYINNERVGTILPDEEIPMSSNAVAGFGISPCLTSGDIRMKGRVDEFRLYPFAFSEAGLRNNYLFPDEIATRDTTIFLGESVDISLGQTCQSVVGWSPAATIDDPTGMDVTATPTETTIYTVNLSDSYCNSSDDITVFVVDPDDFDCSEILLPSAFTPNGDQLNDTYGISNTFIVEQLDLFYILDRWGNRVFTTTDPNGRWDGTYNGERLPPGSFTYVINYTCRGESFSKVGKFVLLV